MANYFQEKGEEFKRWFNEKEHPYSKLNKNVLFHDLLRLIGLVLVFLIVYNNSYRLNEVVVLFIKLGGVIELVLGYFIIVKAFHVGINLRYGFRGLNHGTKLLIAIFVVLLIFWAYQNQAMVVDKVTQKYDNVNWKSFSPVKMNLSALGIGNLTKSLNTCPQINVPINFYGYNSFDGNVGSIAGKTYDGWKINGVATCRKGTKEGENLNRYYCGGYSYIFGMGSVNAYIQKTIVSTTGDIGKTYKYVIWNTYDENKKFVETKCIGNPDDFEQKQAEAFYNEMLRWS